MKLENCARALDAGRSVMLYSTAELDALMASDVLAGRAIHLLTLHDDPCSPARCVCDPWFVIAPLTALSLEEGARLTAEWRRTAS